jgi:hypothetical protein
MEKDPKKNLQNACFHDPKMALLNQTNWHMKKSTKKYSNFSISQNGFLFQDQGIWHAEKSLQNDQKRTTEKGPKSFKNPSKVPKYL